MSPSGPRFALHAAAHSARSLDALSARLSDPVGTLEVGQHQDLEQLGAGSRTEGVKTLSETALEFIRTHVNRRLRRRIRTGRERMIDRSVHWNAHLDEIEATLPQPRALTDRR